MPSRDMIVNEVRQIYGAKADEAIQALDRYEGSAAANQNRVHRAILKLHDGTFDNLKRWVQVALYDYRDVLGPAEYPGPTTDEEIRRFNNWKLDDATTKETSFGGIVEESGDNNGD
jgi:hypothetical protein